MNELAIELFKKAGTEAYRLCKENGHNVSEIDSIWVSIMSGTFAELIVRECVDVCKSRVGNSDYNTGRMHCVSDLKDHFGIE